MCTSELNIWATWEATGIFCRVSCELSMGMTIFEMSSTLQSCRRVMTGQGAWAQLIGLRFDLAVRRHGLDRHRLELRTDLFRRCPDERQLGLF